MAKSTENIAERFDTEDIWQKDQDHFLHPWTHFESFKKNGSLVIADSEGIYVYDSDGKKYLDGIGGLWCVNVGYGRTELIDAMTEQARQLVFFNPFTDTTNPPAANLAAKLATIAPANLNRVFFTNSGSMANDSAIRLCQFYHSRNGSPNKKHVIARKDSYHGSSYLAASVSGKSADRSPHFDYIEDTIHHVSSPNTYRRPEHMTEADFGDFLVEELEAQILKIGADRVSCFIAEPILGAGGVIVPPDGYHSRTSEVCKRHGVLYISDEVVTAFGRLGTMFASESVFGFEPDIITCAKGLTSGYQPLGAYIYSDEIHRTISADGEDVMYTNGFTYSGHPIACAVGLRNIELMEEENLCEHVQEVGPYFEKRLQELRELDIVGDVRGSHLMMCVENIADKETRELFPAEVNIGKRISNRCEELGVIIRPVGHLNILSPPLIITKDEIDQLVEVLRRSITEVALELRKEGISG